jgi:septal ring factor EnvC (AmiA/AmiB activator)
MASQRDLAAQRRRQRLQEQQRAERERLKTRQREQEAALTTINRALERRAAADRAVAQAVARALDVFDSPAALADVSDFSVREIRNHARVAASAVPHARAGDPAARDAPESSAPAPTTGTERPA